MHQDYLLYKTFDKEELELLLTSYKKKRIRNYLFFIFHTLILLIFVTLGTLKNINIVSLGEVMWVALFIYIFMDSIKSTGQRAGEYDRQIHMLNMAIAKKNINGGNNEQDRII